MPNLSGRNWNRLLVSTLRRARELLPGPGPIFGEAWKKMDALEQQRFLLGADIDQILELSNERKDGPEIEDA